MQPTRRPIDDFIYHPAFCHLARGTAILTIVEASTRSSREHFGASGSQGGESDKGAARPAWHAMGQRLAALMVTLHLPRPRVNIRAAYAAIVPKAVTIVTLVCRSRTRRARLDPTVGALRNTGLFVRSNALRWHEAGDSESQLMPANIIVTNPSQRQ